MTMLHSAGMQLAEYTPPFSFSAQRPKPRQYLRMRLEARKTLRGSKQGLGAWQVMGAGETSFCPLAFFLRVTRRAGWHFGKGTSRFLFPRLDRTGSMRSGPSPLEEGKRRMEPTFLWAEQAQDADRIKYQALFQRALVACCGVSEADALSMWTTHAGRVGMQTDGDERKLDRRKTRLLGGWAFDAKERSQDHYSRTVATLSSLSAERGF